MEHILEPAQTKSKLTLTPITLVSVGVVAARVHRPSPAYYLHHTWADPFLSSVVFSATTSTLTSSDAGIQAGIIADAGQAGRCQHERCGGDEEGELQEDPQVEPS